MQVDVCGVKCDAELMWVASRLGENEPAFDRGERGGRKPYRVSVTTELAARASAANRPLGA